jgi:nitrile hydratase
MGGMHGFGPVVRERDEPVFHHEWERRMFALALAMMGRRTFNIDEYRQAIERMPPEQYLATSYYEHWLYAFERLLVEKGIVARTEIDVVMAALRAGAQPPRAPLGNPDSAADDVESAPDAAGLAESLGGGARSLRYDERYRARFKVGDRVVGRNRNPVGHTRIPRYVRGRHGVISRDWGVFIFPDTHASGEGTNPQHCYAVEFAARELWGSDYPADDRVHVDLWEDYLEADRDARSSATPSLKNGSRTAASKSHGKSGAKGPAARPVRVRAEKKRSAPPDGV